jgi:hypothetical protein
MKVSLNIKICDQDIKDHIQKTGMTEDTIVGYMRSAAQQAAEDIVNFSLNLSDTESLRQTDVDIRDDNDIPYDYINIEGLGNTKILGGVTIKDKDGSEKTVLLVEDVGTKPLFEIRGKKAIWNGGLSSTAQVRFFKTKEGDEFKYSRVHYRKLHMHEVRQLYKENKTYSYEMPKE